MPTTGCHLHGVLELVGHGLPTFPRGLGGAREIDDERQAAGERSIRAAHQALHATSAREHGTTGLCKRIRADRLGDAGNVALAHHGRCLGRHIAGRQARAPAGQDDIRTELIGRRADGVRDVARVIARENGFSTGPETE